MEAINYYNLLAEVSSDISSSDWEQILTSVTSVEDALGADVDTAFEIVQNILFECSQDWLEKRIRITRAAESISSSPTRRSEYCLKALQNLVYDAVHQASMERESPELSLVKRQIQDHLRSLTKKQVLQSHRLRTKAGQDVANIWGLSSWGANWREQPPEKEINRVKQHLPFITAYSGGKGVFDYADVLPAYIPQILKVYGAPLSTSEICSIIISRISPPLLRYLSMSEVIPQSDTSDEFLVSEYCRTPSPEDLFKEKQLQELFISELSDRELKILQMKEDEIPIAKIADNLCCSVRTVNGDWQNIFLKAKKILHGC